MADILDFDSKRAPREHKRKDQRTARLRADLQRAREDAPEGQGEGAPGNRNGNRGLGKLLALYKHKSKNKNPKKT